MDDFKIDFDGITKSVFSNTSLVGKADLTLADIISKFIPYIYVIAGLILFAFLIIGGFNYLTSGGDPKKVETAQAKITQALIGFLIIFLAYWLGRILEIVFGIEIF